MAVITPVAMAIFAVFIASVHGNSTCQVAPCKCSFSNIEILRKHIDERINTTVAAMIAELTATTEDSISSESAKINTTVAAMIAELTATTEDRLNAIRSESAMWTPVAKTNIGVVKLVNATAYDFQIPNVIPPTAMEFMIYATVKCGYANLRRISDIILYVWHNGLRFEKFLYMHGYDQNALNTNSDNMWFPMPTDRLVHLEITVAIPGNCNALLSTIGYR